jgi:hypothetical protein
MAAAALLPLLSADGNGEPPAKRFRATQKLSPLYMELLGVVGCEDGGLNQQVYLATVSRVLPGHGAAQGLRDIANLSRSDLASMMRDSFEHPIPTPAGGRPRAADSHGGLVDILVVAKELHADGSPHFHVVIRLKHRMRFHAAKRTLQQRHKLPSHWSSSHSQLWSAVRYVHVATPKKPMVDADIYVWAHSGGDVDLTELPKEPCTALAWRKRREAKEANSIAQGMKMPSFNKLDLMSLVLSKHLHTKTQLLAYAQDHGSPQAQLFVSRQQRRLAEFIEDAHEWADAKAEVITNSMTEWDILCKAANTPCPHAPGTCFYTKAVDEIFEKNIATLCPRKLACALKAVLLNGPSKTCRVPILIGASNTGKSTLLYPFDDLFGPKHVLHKPALGSTFALRNIVKKKRFIFWDDFRPVEFAHKDTVPIATFLSLFIGKDTEIQVSQSFNDGNLDVCWKRGVVFTAKEDGLWDPTSKISAEDVRHLKNRVQEFRLTHVLVDVKEVESCASCMSRWIAKYSAGYP